MIGVNRQMLVRVLIQGSYINENGGIRLLFRLNVVKDYTPVSLNHPLIRRNITQAITQAITQVSLNNTPVTLFTVRIQRRK